MLEQPKVRMKQLPVMMMMTASKIFVIEETWLQKISYFGNNNQTYDDLTYNSIILTNTFSHSKC